MAATEVEEPGEAGQSRGDEQLGESLPAESVEKDSNVLVLVGVDADDDIVGVAVGRRVLRCSYGDRLVVLYARGVAALVVAPRGAVL